MSAKKATKKPLIQSVERALDILEIIAASEVPLQNGDVVNALGIKPNTVNNLLRVLYQRGYLGQNRQRGYILGYKCRQLNEYVDQWASLRESTLPVMREISETTGDLCFLGVLENLELVCLEQVAGTGVVTISDRHAWSEKTHASASGKLLLSALSASDLDNYFSKNQREKFTAATIISEKALRKELSNIKKVGYATTQDESAAGVSAIGVPIYGKDTRVIASLGQSFPTYLIENGKIDLNKRYLLLKNAAEKISRKSQC